MESLNVKSGPNVIAGLKCKVQNNKKIQKTQTSVIYLFIYFISLYFPLASTK